MACPITRRTLVTSLSIGAASAILPSSAWAFDVSPEWTTPLDPFRIAGNLYYVGSRDLASYLLTTPQGHILINSNLVTSPPQIRASVEKLGFHFKDIRILLISHAHYDHCAGSAQILRETGAQYIVMNDDVPAVESGARTGVQFGTDIPTQFPAAKVTRALHDKEVVQLGNITLTAHKTAGHTKGCTTWTLKVIDKNRALDAVIVGSPNVLPGYNLLHDPKYPQMASDFMRQFEILQSLPCDLFLGAHGGYFDLLEKLPERNSSSNPFIDPAGYKAFVQDSKQAFEAELKRQQAKHPTPHKN